jgi:hypothetical protein
MPLPVMASLAMVCSNSLSGMGVDDFLKFIQRGDEHFGHPLRENKLCYKLDRFSREQNKT